MKNILVIGLVSLVLFGVSAGLSVWLQSNQKPADTSHDEKDKKKKAADDHGDGKEKGGEHPDPKGKEPEKPAEVKPPSSKDVERAEYRRLQMEVVAADLTGQMQEYDKLLKKVGAEMKQLMAKQDELDAKAVEVKEEADRTAKTAALIKTSQDGGEDEQANIARMAALADQMTPAGAAQIIQQLADSGKTDTAVKMIAQMKERTAAKALDAITDQTLIPALFLKLEKLKKPAPPPAEMP
jgi:hypothetical protein